MTNSPPNPSRPPALLGLALALMLALTGAGLVLPARAEAAPLSVSSLVPTNADSVLGSNVPVPSGAIFVATNGSDTNAGTIDKPFATVTRALKAVKPGGTVVLRGGVYRQGIQDPAPGANYQPHGTLYNPVTLPENVTLQGYPLEKVWLDGTDVVTGWTRVSATHYTKRWETPTFCGSLYYTRHYSSQSASGPCSHTDSIGGASSLGDPQMAFRNGAELKQVRTLGELSSSTFFYDHSARTMHIGFDPSGSLVELTKRAQALAFFNPRGLAIRNLGVRRYGSNAYTNATAGAVLINGGQRVTLDRVAIVANAGGGLQVWNSRSMVIRSSVLMSNGYTGLRTSGSYHQNKADRSVRDDMLVEYSRMDDNNRDRYDVDCTFSCSAAGAKLTYMVGFIVRYSAFNNNGGDRASGLWCDVNCIEGKIYGNEVKGNARHGIVYEVSDKAIIASNLVTGNGFSARPGFGLMIGSANVRIYNNTVAGNAQTVKLYDDDRAPSDTAGPHTVNLQFANNVVAGGSYEHPQVVLTAGSRSVAGNTKPSQFMAVMDHNSYHRRKAESRWWVNWRGDPQVNTLYQLPAELQKARGKERAGQHSDAEINPFLTNPTAGDYSVKSGSPAAGSAAPIPSDIASLLGVPSTGQNRGVVNLGGSSAAPPAPLPPPSGGETTTTSASDDFSRSVSGSWGAASSGGRWSTPPVPSVKTSGAEGVMELIPGRGMTASLPQVSSAATDTNVTFSLSRLPVSGLGTMVSVRGREVSGRGAYMAKMWVAEGSDSASLWLERSLGASDLRLATSATRITVPAGAGVTVRLQAVGVAPTTLRAKVWRTGTPEPAGWHVTATDSASALQEAGSVGVWAYQAPDSPNSTVVRFDDLRVRKV